MATFLQALRFSTGLAMMAGGAVLVAPVAYDVVERAGTMAPLVMQTTDEGMAPPSVNVGHTIPDPRMPGDPAQRLTVTPPPVEMAVPPVPRPAYQPPAPPPPLPAAFPGGFVTAEPGAAGLDGTYRSTLRVPPPPLLDSAGPPPVAPGWTSRQPAAAAAVPARGAIPQSYIIQDGDSLTSLAIRFYGHPGAAGAILEANRDVLARPDMLPIGGSIRLPPPWTVAAARPTDGPQTIEPGPAVDRGRPVEVGRSPFAPASAPKPWLNQPAT